MSGESPQQKEGKGEAVAPDVLGRALESFRHLVRGNGIAPAAIRIKDFSGHMLDFEARTIFQVRTVVSESYLNGKPQGPVLKSKEELQHEIAEAASKTAAGPAIRPALMDSLAKRGDMGFGFNAETITLPLPASRFILPLPCEPCHGTKVIACAGCRGTGRAPCIKCHGRREITCLSCRGTQFQFAGQQKVSCRVCRGRGRVGCPTCRQTGQTPCLKCRSAGKMPCRACGGTGTRSLVTTITYKAEGAFEYDRSTVPPQASLLLEKLKGTLVADKHAEARYADAAPQAPEAEIPGRVVLPSRIRLPFGAITFEIGNEETKGWLFGNQPFLTGFPPFFEKIAAPGFQALAQAAQPGGHKNGGLEKAIKFRLTGDIVLAAASFAPAKAFKFMQKRYPYGMGDDALKSGLRHAAIALKGMGRGPRLLGLTIGLMLSIILYGAWFAVPLRPVDLIAADAVFAAVCGTLTVLSIRLTASRAVGRVLGRLQKGGRQRFLRDGGFSLWTGTGVSLLTGLIILHGSFIAGRSMPSWYAVLLQMAGF